MKQLRNKAKWSEIHLFIYTLVCYEFKVKQNLRSKISITFIFHALIFRLVVRHKRETFSPMKQNYENQNALTSKQTMNHKGPSETFPFHLWRPSHGSCIFCHTCGEIEVLFGIKWPKQVGFVGILLLIVSICSLLFFQCSPRLGISQQHTVSFHLFSDLLLEGSVSCKTLNQTVMFFFSLLLTNVLSWKFQPEVVRKHFPLT